MQYQVTIPDETAELIKGLVAFVESVKESLDDGWQPGIDIPMIVMKALNDLPTAIAGIDEISDEAKQDPAGMIAAVGILAADLYKVLVEK